MKKNVKERKTVKQRVKKKKKTTTTQRREKPRDAAAQRHYCQLYVVG